MRISDWSSDLCSSDLSVPALNDDISSYGAPSRCPARHGGGAPLRHRPICGRTGSLQAGHEGMVRNGCIHPSSALSGVAVPPVSCPCRSEEHTSELQSLMRISYAVFCLKKKTKKKHLLHTIEHKIQH